eukprot:TRINITY_DN306_c0_g1_i1.p1 TRINITY_DN306_c0_g1~~TRINITY_DN306_c0_g1_i1.p1  ORF type:complete len:265 (+),score=48.84 TRINITY_DN306_c0_g1_i1:68-796(+)
MYQQPSSQTFNEPPPPYGSQSNLPRPSSTPTMQQNRDPVKLFNTNKEREMYDNMADLYSLIKTMEYLEKAFLRDSISAKDYAPACTKLIAQYKTAQNLLKDTVPSLPNFLAEYKLECKAAMDRFAKGYPATVEHAISDKDTSFNSQKTVAEVVQHFITTMDSLKLNLVAIDSIFPLINDLMESLNKVPHLGPDFDGKIRIRGWLTVMHQMKASDELNSDQVRQLLFDLESAYNAFHKSLVDR